jgi:TrmH family RNA methyltransferase
MKLKRYKKEFAHAYTMGTSPTIELLKTKPELVLKVIVHSKLVPGEGLQRIRTYIDRHGIRHEQNDRLIESLWPKRDCFVIGVFSKYAPALDDGADHVVLVNPRSAGNLGTVIRCMVAFGFHDLALIEPAADVFNPSTIRSSMGALFSVRFQHFPSITEYATRHAAHRLYPFMTTGRSTLEQTAFTQPYSVLFGNESSGLPGEYEMLGESVRIAHAAAVDSLNVAITAGITLHHLCRSSHAKVQDPGHVS